MGSRDGFSDNKLVDDFGCLQVVERCLLLVFDQSVVAISRHLSVVYR
jgi:hypothetical protein